MNIRINRLILQNFKGIKSLEIDAGGSDLNIYGDNATGKTTIFDAFTWLLFGKDSLGRADFGIKTQDADGNTLHNLEHSVECEMLIDDSILTLKKVYAEKWTKKRGSADAEFSGHETKYFANEVPTTKKEYEQKIAGLIGEELFKIITNPLYFNEHLKWQDRRAILLSLCGDVSDADIMASTAEFAPLIDELKGRTVQEYKKILQSKQAAINDNLKAIPQRIAEAQMAMPEIGTQTADELQAEKDALDAQIADLQAEKIAIKQNAGIIGIEAKKTAFINEKNIIISRPCDTAAIDAAFETVKSKLSSALNEIAELTQKECSLKNHIETSEKIAAELREKWYALNAKKYAGDGICPTCGQALPQEQIAEAEATFNIAKVEELEKITAQGKKANADADIYRQKCAEIAKRITELQNTIDAELAPEIERLKAEKAQAEKAFAEAKSAEIADIDAKIADLEKKATAGANDIEADTAEIDAKIAECKAHIATLDKAIAARDLAEKQAQRIAELEADEKRLATEYATHEKTVYLIDNFIKYKIGLVSDKINALFTMAKFKLFDVQINGGIAECCEVMFDGVPYGDLNNASRINVGLDIINTLCGVHGKSAPIIVDNAESVTSLLNTKSQQIKLIVSALDDALRIEKNEKE